MDNVQNKETGQTGKKALQSSKEIEERNNDDDDDQKSQNHVYGILCMGKDTPPKDRLTQSVQTLRQAKREEGRQFLPESKERYVVITDMSAPLALVNTRDETIENDGMGAHRVSAEKRFERTRSQSLMDRVVTNTKRCGQNMRNIAGCCHPQQIKKCNVCSLGHQYLASHMGQFLNHIKLQNEMLALKSYRFETPLMAKNAYTFFNQRWNLFYKLSVKDFYLEHYSQLRLAMVRCRKAHHHSQNHETESMGSDDNFRRVTREKKPRAYCSSVYLPGDTFEHTSHAICDQLPSTDLYMTFSAKMYGLPTALIASIVGTPSDRLIDHDHFVCRTQQKKNYIESISKKSKLDSSNVYKKIRARDEVGETDEDGDERDKRLLRMEHSETALKQFRDRGVRLILLTKTPELPRRTDLHITQSDDYINVFYVNTPELSSSEEEAMIWQT